MGHMEGYKLIDDEGEKSKRKKNFFFYLRIFFKFIFLGIVFTIFGAIVFIFSIYKEVKTEFKKAKPRDNVTQNVFFDKKENIIYESYGAKKPEQVALKDLPENVVRATLAAEDLDFYKHEAYDLKGIVRAVYNNYMSTEATGLDKIKVLLDEKSYTEGGSTITQQLVKNRYLTNERRFERKFKEIVYSVEMEKKLSKDEILEQYISYIYYGEQALGIKNAAKIYFEKDVEDLSLAEASMLAGLPAAPTRYSPVSGDFLESKKRQEYVLQRMYLAGFITLEEAKIAANEDMEFSGKKEFVTKYPFYVDWVKEELVKKYGAEKVEAGGLNVYTSLDPDIQKFTEEKALDQIKKFEKYNVSNAAVIVADTKTNEVMAMVGGVDYEKSKVNVATALRQPGSSFKPVVYYAGLEKGYNASSKLLDKYVNFSGYSPKNYDGSYRGYVTIRESLANSLNVPAVEILSLVGLEEVIDLADSLGFGWGEDAKRCGLSLALGCKEARLIDLVRTYSTFAGNGTSKSPSGIIKVLDAKDEDVTIIEKSKKLLDPANSYIITNILSDEKARRKVFGAGNKLEIKRPAAAKTGTTDNYTDSWTVGYTPDFVVGVWLGNNDRKPMKTISGIEGAAYLWHDIMMEIHKDRPIAGFEKPSGVVEARISPTDGGVITAKTGGVLEIFKESNVPTGKEDLGYLNRFR